MSSKLRSGFSLNTVKQIGEFIYPDNKGYFNSNINLGQPLQKAWQQPVRLCVQEIQKQLPNLISSIYLRGSVARGTAIAGISDIDLVIIVKNELPAWYSRGWVAPFIKQLRSNYPQVGDAEFEIVSLRSLLNLKKPVGLRVLLSLQGKLLIGEDIVKHLPPVMPDSSSFVHIPTFTKFQARLNKTLITKDVFLPAYISWVAKRYVRTGFEICIEREKVFTRDLYPCFVIFSKYYPSKANEMHKVLGQAINPTWTKQSLLNCINNLGFWLDKEIKKMYPEYK